MKATDITRFAGARKAIRFYLRERVRRGSMRSSTIDPTTPRVPRILAAMDKDAATYAELAKCWVESMPCDRPGKIGFTPTHQAIIVAYYGPHPFSKDRISQHLCNKLGLTLYGLGRATDHAEAILSWRYKSRGLLSGLRANNGECP